ncbi:MAG: F0F1 ATP synthase subunit A [Microcoleus sp. SU_5_3]|nr:F0F1 ATP synthase subunit A [Microcoleus sp. SU_5_3]
MGSLRSCLRVAVPIFGIRQQGICKYFRHYLEPSPILLPLHVVSEFSQTLALAVRLFGNVIDSVLWSSHCPVAVVNLLKKTH